MSDTTETTVGASSSPTDRRAKPGQRFGGRVKGTPNKLTHNVRQAIEQVAVNLGGVERLTRWAAEPENERLFWSQMYLKLVPKEVKAELSGEIGPASPVLVVPAPLTPEGWSEVMAAYQSASEASTASVAASKDKASVLRDCSQ